MARTDATDTASPELTVTSLNRLLGRLEKTLLSGQDDPSLKTSPYARNKVNANLEHARSLLLRLEHESAGTKGAASQRANVQADLRAKRALVKRLTDRLSELNQLDDGDSSDSDEDGQQGVSYAPARKDASDTVDREYAPPNEALHTAAENLTATMRARKPQQAAEDAGLATGSSHLPPGTTAGPSSRAPDPSVSRTETLLSHNRTEQEQLTSSLLNMAKALKQQSVQFGTSLEADKGSLDHATAGLDKNQTGMEAAEKRMGTLRKMTEGKGWWGRILMYAWIAGLWLAAFLIVFVMPKLRF